MQNILELRSIVKSYKNKLAVDKVSFSVPPGRIFGLLGPNGAGKTTLLRIITSIIEADEGKVLIDGNPIRSMHTEMIGYLPEERGLYRKMKVGEHLIYLARLKGLSSVRAKQAVQQWLEKFEIVDWYHKKVDELSKGMQQKVQFIATVLHQPNLLILDEPFSGLDPINTNLIKDEIRRFRESGVSILFSTHRMEQVEEICEDIVLINDGKNVLSGQVAEIKKRFKENIFEIEYDRQLPQSLQRQYQILETKEGKVVVKLDTDQDSNELLKLLINHGNHVYTFREILPSLNDIFIRQVKAVA